MSIVQTTVARCAWLLLGFLIASNLWAQSEETIVVADGVLEIPVTRFTAFEEQAPILLWLPSARGTSSKQAITATALADKDIETWVVDLHSAYFVDEGRNSEQHFRPQDIVELIDNALQETTKDVYLMATDAVSKPVLEAIALYQQQTAEINKPSRMGGLILFHPRLTIPATEPGTPARFHAIAENSTVPIYYIQPSISTRQWRSREIINALETGGSNVYFHPMQDISAGYHLRPDDDLSDLDFKQRERLPDDIKRAIMLLALQAKPLPPPVITQVKTTPQIDRYGLKTVPNKKATPLSLVDLQAQEVIVDYSQHKLTLLSFWASWCDPCLRELPAVKRLSDDYAGKGLQIITVNVGETAAQVENAIDQFEMSAYTNLLDPKGVAMNSWNVYGFPTNFLINPAGRISHASFGAVEWDEPDVRTVIDTLLPEL